MDFSKDRNNEDKNTEYGNYSNYLPDILVFLLY